MAPLSALMLLQVFNDGRCSNSTLSNCWSTGAGCTLHGQGTACCELQQRGSWGSYGVNLDGALNCPQSGRTPRQIGPRLAVAKMDGVVVRHWAACDLFGVDPSQGLTGDATLARTVHARRLLQFWWFARMHLIVGNLKPRLRGGDHYRAAHAAGARSTPPSGAAKDGLPTKLKAEAPAIWRG